MIEKPTVSEVIFEMIKLRAGDAIPAGWDERARAAIIQHANDQAALEAVAEAAKLIDGCSEIRPNETPGGYKARILEPMKDALENLAAVRAGHPVQLESKVDHIPLVEALMSIASWPEGGEVDGSFDEPSAATAARAALAKVGIVGGVK